MYQDLLWCQSHIQSARSHQACNFTCLSQHSTAVDNSCILDLVSISCLRGIITRGFTVPTPTNCKYLPSRSSITIIRSVYLCIIQICKDKVKLVKQVYYSALNHATANAADVDKIEAGLRISCIWCFRLGRSATRDLTVQDLAIVRNE